MTSRRRFLAAGGAGALLARGGYAAKSELNYSEIEARIARKEFRDLTKEDIGTPALILDEALFQKNLETMAAHNKSTGLKLRAHVKIHKCPEISKRQIALGANGVCCATTAECELMVNSGIRGVLHTCQPAGRNQIARTVALARREPTFTGVLDDPITVDALEEALAAAHAKMNVIVDVFAGLNRQGCQPGEPALQLAQKVDQSKHLKLVGMMGYSGNASHTHGWEARKKRSTDDVAAMLGTVELCRKSGLPIEIITGGSTGTYNIDTENHLTELQAGSYIFMDTIYRKIGGKTDENVYADFEPALSVMTTVISKTRLDQCAVDYGNKAMLRETDEVKGQPGIRIQSGGAEYGMLLWNDSGRDIKLGGRLEIYPSNLDTSVNVYDRIYVARNESIVDVWPIMGRAGAVQR
ncbi:MAG TPA: alanine racemase [Bryobacteraceae bacterium]|nr:alanine racemase [Bryobacteraceae bacterium]